MFAVEVVGQVEQQGADAGEGFVAVGDEGFVAGVDWSRVGCYQGAGSWTIGPDEPATKDQVCELLVRSAGIYELQDY